MRIADTARRFMPGTGAFAPTNSRNTRGIIRSDHRKKKIIPVPIPE